MKPNFATSALYALDNLEVMRGMDSESVPLIYADPPFNSKRIYQGMSGTKAARHSFRDTWSWNDAKQEWLEQLWDDAPELYQAVLVAKEHSPNMGGYAAFMAVRLIEMRRILTPDGSLYLHCDPSANAYLRVLLDSVFGSKNFRNEIVWQRIQGAGKSSQFESRSYGVVTDVIYWYTKTDQYEFDIDNAAVPYSESALTKYNRHDSKGPYYRRSPFRPPGLGSRPNLCFQYKGVTPPHSSGWVGTYEFIQQLDKAGDLEWTDNKVFRKQRPGKGIHPHNLWTDIPQVGGNEDTGWATQKPLALLERIIKASSKEGDIVFDPFCGCGTALVAAERQERRWVGADDDVNAIDVVRERVASLKGIVATDQAQFQSAVTVKSTAPDRTEDEPDKTGIIKDPTGFIIPKMPSDKMNTADIRKQLLEWQTQPDGKVKCPGCGECLLPRHFEVDHIDPKNTGGSNRIDNRILLCGACNRDKSNTKTLAQLWNEQNIRGKKRDATQDYVKDVRDRARRLVQQMDAGWIPL